MTAAPSSQAVERAHRAFRDGSALRVVGRARLKVDHVDQAWSAQQALEDGLNTADFADCGRLIVVRSLRLRGLDGAARGPAIARAIEAAWRALAPSALSFDAPGAASAPAVYFQSATAARLAWLQCVAESRTVDAWFWRSALPELAAAPSDEAAVAAVFTGVLRDRPQALATALRRWPTSSVRWLLAGRPALLSMAASRWANGALRPAIAEARRASAGDAPAPVEGVAAHASAAAVETGIVAWLARLELHDDDTLAALATLVLAPDDTSPIAIEKVAAAVVQAQAQSARHMRDAAWRPPAHTLPATRETVVGPIAAGPSDRGSGAMNDGIAPHASTREAEPLPLTAPPSAARASAHDPARNARWPWLAGNEPTAHGGLLMLLNVLRRMDFEAWLDAQAPADREPLVALLFETLADRLCVPTDDPHRVLFNAAELLRSDAAAREAIGLWVRRLRRVLRLQARIGLASLVRREAGIAVTATHVDVVMPLQGADLRLRRAGLDSDPGWLPWFGWIVKLHYVAVE